MAKKNLYICDNCGAEIFVHDIESIKECSYCGNIIAVIEVLLLIISLFQIYVVKSFNYPIYLLILFVILGITEYNKANVFKSRGVISVLNFVPIGYITS